MYVWKEINAINSGKVDWRALVKTIVVGRQSNANEPDKLALVQWNPKYRCWEHTITGGRLAFEPTHLLLIEPIPELVKPKEESNVGAGKEP